MPSTNIYVTSPRSGSGDKRAESACSDLQTAMVHLKSQGSPEYSHGNLVVVVIGLKVSRRTVNSICRGQTYQDSASGNLISL